MATPMDRGGLAPAPAKDRFRTARLVGWIAFLAVLALVPLSGDYATGLVCEVLVFGIFAMSLDLLIGYTGLLSFGHAAFFGASAYTVAILGVHFGISAWLGLLAGVVVSAALAAVIGFFSIRVTGIPFLMLTMAFAQLLMSTAITWRSVTGGTDGLSGLRRPSLFGFSLDERAVQYYVIAVGFVLVMWFLRRLIASPLGSIFIGIRENEQRMRAAGYPVQRFKLIAFTIAGALAGVGGGLYALQNAYVSSDILHWSLSGDAIIMVILGGTGTIVGPAIGAGIFLMLKYVVSSHTDYWALCVGIVFILIVMFLPQGLWGWIRARFTDK
jgi:branched-chain amino acid transport system permease protein